LYLDVEYIKNDAPIEVVRYIKAYSLESSKIIDDFELPPHYYLYTNRDLLAHDGSLYHMLTSEKDVSVFHVGFDGSAEKTRYPEQYYKPYHYNDHLPKIENEIFIREAGPKAFLAYDQIKRTEIMDNARPYMDIHWYCSPENSSNNEIIRLPDSAYIRTPEWVAEGNLVAVPYKWGGFTHIDNFSDRILAGAYGGDNYTSRTDPWAVSFGDTYCVGLDCSGYVSRAWGLTGKEWTGSLPFISYELPYWDQVLKGDIYNKSGSHVMLVVENNPSGTVNIAHASGYDWKVSKWSYTPGSLSGYIPRQYKYVINDLFPEEPETELSQNYPNPFRTSTTISFYMQDPAIVSLKVYNLHGELVGILIDGFVEAGENVFEWHVGKLPAGVYIYRFDAPGYTKTRRCVIVK
jgi:hypothetical protein